MKYHRRTSFFLCYMFLLSGMAAGQTYDNVVISEGKKPDEDNRIFVQGNVLTYLVESNTEDLELPEQIIYTVLGLPVKKRTIRDQTEVVISHVPDQKKYVNTGIVDNASNLWIHPPRSGALSVLETCPFPYVKFPLTEETAWTDSLSIGEQWSQGLWKGRMLFKIKYRVTGKKQMEIDNIPYDCWIIEGTATSDVGTSKTIITYHEDDGFVELVFTTLKGQELTLKLESIIQGPIFKNMNDYFEEKVLQSK